MDLQILDANHYLVGDAWYQETPVNHMWGLPSKLPATFQVSVGEMQNDPIQFSYSNASWNSSTKNSAQFAWSSDSSSYANGFRSGSGGFAC